MDFELSDELAAVRDLAREFAEKEIAPTASKDDKEKNFRADLVKKMGELGFYGTMIPEAYGGNGLGFLAMVLITEEIARAHSAMRVSINMQIGPAVTLLQFGTEEQKQKFIPPLLSGDIIGCFAITESDAGSDVAGMRTVAKKDGDSYLLNGSKIYITNAPVTTGGLVYAYTDRAQKHQGMSAFYADWNQPGLARKPMETLGALCSPIGELTFDNFRIPVANRLGNEGDGFKICMWQLNQTRLNCAAGALGVARAAKEAAVNYCNQRVQFGQKIGEFQMNQDMIAQMIAHEEAARLLVYRAAWLADQRKPNNLETSIGKYAAAEAANYAADAAMKILGAYGYSTEFPVERYYRDAKSYQIVEGSSNVQKMIIAQDALGYRKANR
ncbi:MAG TPA: glutaryl-CoA dehydrogenase Acd [Candidatus Binatia bacterium]